jgi:hypothetical protein
MMRARIATIESDSILYDGLWLKFKTDTIRVKGAHARVLLFWQGRDSSLPPAGSVQLPDLGG